MPCPGRKVICFVLTNYFKNCKGGAELQAYFIAKELAKRGWEVHYISLFEKRKIKRMEPEIDEGIVLHKLRKRPFLRRFGNYYFLEYVNLGKILKFIRPQIIYQRGANAFTGVCALHSKRIQSKFVWASSSVNDCKTFNNRQPSFNPLSSIMNNVGSWFFTYGIRHADEVIVQTNEQQELLFENYGKRGTVIPNSHYIPCKTTGSRHAPLVVWIANVKASKQPRLFIELAKSCEDLQAQFIMAGRLEKIEMQKILQDGAQYLHNFKYIGEISFEETQSLLTDANLFVNTSKFEGFPNTFIQAWLHKTPVVSLQVDPDNILTQEKIGLHSGSFDQLVKDVRYLLENKNEIETMGERARKYAEQFFDIKKNIVRIERLFCKLIGNNS